MPFLLRCVYFFTATAPTVFYTLSLHDALPILSTALGAEIDLSNFQIVDVPHSHASAAKAVELLREAKADLLMKGSLQDRKSTRLNSSHANSSYAVFCLKKKMETLAEIGPRARA